MKLQIQNDKEHCSGGHDGTQMTKYINDAGESWVGQETIHKSLESHFRRCTLVY